MEITDIKDLNRAIILLTINKIKEVITVNITPNEICNNFKHLNYKEHIISNGFKLDYYMYFDSLNFQVLATGNAFNSNKITLKLIKKYD